MSTQTTNLAPTRRTLVKGAAWSVPVISIVAAAPAFAASPEPVITTGPKTSKCPGNATDDPFTYIFTFGLSAEPMTFVVTSLIINGQVFDVARVVIDGKTVHVVSVASTNSADAEGNGSVTYTVNGVQHTYLFVYKGSHPNLALCKKI